MSRRIPRRAFVVATLCSVVALVGVDQSSQGQGGFPQPAVFRSSGGLLSVRLHAMLAGNFIRDAATGDTRLVNTPTYNGTLPGPTLRVRPGDRLDIGILNQLPANPLVQRMGGFPHDPYTTNLHTHGFTVSPQGISDNVLRVMEPGTANLVRVQLPGDHPSGTFWYHPHKHGSATFQFFGGMAGFLIVEGGAGTLDRVPEVSAARDILMAFQVIRTDTSGDLPFVDQAATQLGTDFGTSAPGVWSTLKTSHFYFTTNGVTNPTLRMAPGEVQRWRFLNAASGETLVIALQGHALNIVANDGITVPTMQALAQGQPYVLGTGQRADVLVKAGAPGTYLVQALDPAAAPGWSVVSGSGIDPAPRNARLSADLPAATYPVTLATLVVTGTPRNMPLPAGPLPPPRALPSIQTMLDTSPNVVRRIAFEICGQRVFQQPLTSRLPSCGWYFDRYGVAYWGDTAFTSLNMMRDDDDAGTPSADPATPLVDFEKEALFTHDTPLFDDMFAGNFEEWTVTNRSFSDHTFHIHQNPFLVTHVNGTPLAVPEWHDTIIVPAAQPQPGAVPVNINDATFGSITIRMRFDPVTVGAFVMHCHILNHEDVGMMQRLEIKRRPAASSPAATGRRLQARHRH